MNEYIQGVRIPDDDSVIIIMITISRHCGIMTRMPGTVHRDGPFTESSSVPSLSPGPGPARGPGPRRPRAYPPVVLVPPGDRRRPADSDHHDCHCTSCQLDASCQVGPPAAGVTVTVTTRAGKTRDSVTRRVAGHSDIITQAASGRLSPSPGPSIMIQ